MEKMRTYKAVIFDYGGVIMSYNKEVPEWTSLEDKYDIPRGSIQKIMFAILKEMPDLEKLLFEGHITAEEIEENIIPEYFSKKLGIDLPRPLRLLNLWMGPGSAIPLNDSMLRAVSTLKRRGLHTSILTNNYKMDRAGMEVRTPVDNTLFDFIVESSREGVMKPDPLIYKITQSRIPPSISPRECIFLDDNNRNIQAAVEFGWTAIHVDPHSIEQAILKLETLLKIDLTQCRDHN